MKYYLRISGGQFDQLKHHLFPGDGFEASAICLCGRFRRDDEEYLLVHKVIEIPYEECKVRTPVQVTWSTKSIITHLDEARDKEMAIIKVHSHPTNYPEFSDTDDKSDLELLGSIYGWMGDNRPHGSLVLLSDDRMFGRVLTESSDFVPFKKISVASDDITIHEQDKSEAEIPEFSKRTLQTFGEATTLLMKTLKIGVIGCSGTGSPVIEQLVRLGIGTLVLVDPESVEKLNLNRIINATMEDAEKSVKKVKVFKDVIQKINLGTKVVIFDENIYDSVEIIKELASCDILFGCMDSVDGRHLLNTISTFYNVPYFDLGVKIIPDKKGGIDQICGAVHYIKPGFSSLLTRGVYTGENLRAAALKRANAEDYETNKIAGYLSEVNVTSPAVISINMLIASIAVNDFLARLHPFRYSHNENFAVTRVDLSDWTIMTEKEGKKDMYLNKFVGRGDIEPLLNMPELSATIE